MNDLLKTINQVNNEFHFGLNRFQVELLAIRIKQSEDNNYKRFKQSEEVKKRHQELRIVR